MSFIWNPLGLWPLVVALIAWALAAIVYSARPGRAQNRWLALTLLTEPFLFVWGSPFIVFTSTSWLAWTLARVSLLCAAVFLIAYLLFLATLETPLVRPLRSRAGRIALFLLAPAYLVVFMFVPGTGVESIARSAPFTWTIEFGKWFPHVQSFTIIIFLYGFAAAMAAWLHAAPGSSTRVRAKIFAVGIGIRDLSVLTLIATIVFFTGGEAASVGDRTTVWLLMPAVVLIFLLILSYGVLKHQLFGIELQVKWTLKRGTALVILAAAFFVVKESVEFFLPLKGLVPSLGGAAAVGLVAYPAWKGATRLAERAMPGIEDTPEYRDRRAREIYRAALEEILSDGTMTRKERRVVEGLRHNLSLTAADAEGIETAVWAAAGMERPGMDMSDPT